MVQEVGLVAAMAMAMVGPSSWSLAPDRKGQKHWLRHSLHQCRHQTLDTRHQTHYILEFFQWTKDLYSLLDLFADLKVRRFVLGQTVEKPRRQPGKTVPREFLRAQPKRTPKYSISRLPQSFSTVSHTLLNHITQSRIFKNRRKKTLTILKP